MKCQMTVHEIQKGDTLYKLAKQYKTTVPLILLANPGVNPYNLRVGDKLNICEGKRFEEKQGLDELQIVSDFNKVVYQYLGFLQLYMASFSGTEERTEQSLEYLLEVPGRACNYLQRFLSGQHDEPLKSDFYCIYRKTCRLCESRLYRRKAEYFSS